jgi:FkbM family methyltransferase
MSNIVDFIQKDHIRATLVEPDPKCQVAIRGYFKDQSNVTLLPYAIYDYNGTLELIAREQSTFVSDLPHSPATVNDNYSIREDDRFTVECRRFDDLDDGSIDLLSIDTEGAEWYVIKYLKSRPLVISVETHGKIYQNPFLKEILSWMDQNGYDRWFKDKADTVFYRKNAFSVTTAEKLQLSIMDARVAIRRARKKFEKLFTSGKKA